MNTRGTSLAGGLAAVALAASLCAPVYLGNTQFTLARAVPNDVFIFATERHNPEREFLDQYWGDVFDALRQCGIDEDVVELIGSLLGAEHQAEIERLKERASQLLAGVDWGQLAGKEMAFAERLPPPIQIGPGGMIMPVHMVWLFRGDDEGAAHNFEGLAAILEAIVEEVNKAAESEVLVVERTAPMDAQVASVNLLAMAPAAGRLPISVALRDDLVIIALGEQILNDILGLLDGSSSKTALAEDPRFQAAFAKLPPAEDSMEFFDMQAFSKALRAAIGTAVGAIGGPGDVYLNTGMSPEASRLNREALKAYAQGDIKKALALIEQAYEIASENSIVLYNQACFNALSGKKDAALSWLEKAVEGGFYGPGKITSDPDLESLRNEPRYKAALARATKLAEECCAAEDIVINADKYGEAFKLTQQALEAYKQKDYEQGLKLVEQAYAIAPKDSRVLYGLSCFHALLGHKDKALDFLERAVEGGFYCPRHISTDPDLESIRSDKRYEAALTMAKENAAKLTAKKKDGKLALVKRLIDRGMNAVGILDYTAAVESTNGYAVERESIAVLVPDAKDRPIYPVFGKRSQLTDFDRYLPQETISFSVSGGFDPGELYKFIEDTFRVAGPPGEELLAKWTEIQEEIGVDVRKDIIDWIDGDYVTVTLADGGGSVWLIKVADEQAAREKVAAAIEFLSTKLTEAVGKNPGLAMLSMLAVDTSPTLHEDLDGFQNLHLAVAPQQPIVWGVADGYLIVGTSDDAVALCLETARGAHPGIRENARVMSEAIVPPGPFTSVSLTDRRGLGNDLAKGIGIGSMLLGTMGMAVPEPEARLVISKIAGMAAKLTPVVRKIDFYKSTAAHTTFDGYTWHTRSVTHYVSPAERASQPR